jgi:arylsulfatase A-like enzyme
MSNKRPASVIFISLDTLRADVAYSGNFPNLRRLISESTHFSNTVSSSPITPISHTTVMTGLQPFNHGIRHLFRETLRPDVTTIAQMFQRLGYRTGATVSAPGLHSWYGLNRGFEHYDDDLPRLADGSDPLLTVDVKRRGSAKRRAEIVVEQALTWLDLIGNDPCFQFVHFFDCHWPYDAPGEFKNSTRNAYEDEVAYTDNHLGNYLSGLERRGRLHDSLIVCFSDHGEDLCGLYPNDHGGAELGHPEESGHGCLLFDTTQMVPLVFRMTSSIPQGLAVDSQVRLVDIAPTVYELLHIPSSLCLDGISLCPAFSGQQIQARVGYSETFFPREQYEANGLFPAARNLKAIRLENRYKIIWEIEGEAIAVYELINDPNEQQNIGQVVIP